MRCPFPNAQHWQIVLWRVVSIGCLFAILLNPHCAFIYMYIFFWKDCSRSTCLLWQAGVIWVCVPPMRSMINPILLGERACCVCAYLEKSRSFSGRSHWTWAHCFVAFIRLAAQSKAGWRCLKHNSPPWLLIERRAVVSTLFSRGRLSVLSNGRWFVALVFINLFPDGLHF